MMLATPLQPSEVKKIAVLRPNAVGDFVFALPCLHALRRRFPEARIVYLGKQWHADFLRDRPGSVDKVVVMPPCPGVGAPPDIPVDAQARQSFIAAMHAARFDLAVQVYGGGRYANPFIAQFGARYTIGMKAADAAPLDRWVSYGSLQNRRLQMLEVAALVGANTVSIEPELQVTERDRKEAADVLARAAGRPLVVLQPGASDQRRRWPADRFAAVGDVLAAAGACIAINGSVQEAQVVKAVAERMRYPVLDLSGRLSLSGLCGVLERAALVVSNDTGPLHLALAIGTPCVGIYWLTNLMESAPLRQHRHRPALSLRIHCPVCGVENLRTRCEHDVSFLDDVPAEEVQSLALELFHHGHSG